MNTHPIDTIIYENVRSLNVPVGTRDVRCKLAFRFDGPDLYVGVYMDTGHYIQYREPGILKEGTSIDTVLKEYGLLEEIEAGVQNLYKRLNDIPF